MAKWLVVGAADPEGVKERGEFASHGHDGAPLSVLASTFGEAESPTSKIAVGPEGPEDILSRSDQQAPEHGVTALGDAELGGLCAGVALSRPKAEVSADAAAVLETCGVLQCEDVTKRGDRTDTSDLAESIGFGIALPSQGFELAVGGTDLLAERIDHLEQWPKSGPKGLRDVGLHLASEGWGGS
jgi:hypothetical protein